MLVTPGCAKKPNRYQAEFISLFDTVTTIVGYSESKEEFTSIVEEVKEKLTEYHQLFDIYNDYDGINNVKTINDNAGIAPVKVDEMIISMLLFAEEQYHDSDGKINVAMGSVLGIWHDYRERGVSDPQNAELPPMELLAEAAKHTDIEGMLIDQEASTVYLTDPKMSLDVGAVAKGYAVEQAALYLEDQGVDSFLISVGGNIRAVGGKPGGKIGSEIEPWNIGIKDPLEKDGNLEMCNVLIDGYSVVSSGTYERYYTVDGEIYHHIIDPSTLMPAAHFTSVTIVCRDSGAADALSTAVFNMPLDTGREFIEGSDGVEALWVLHDGEIIYSRGFRDFLKADLVA
ncbi:MAG: FAD:protein FMN transferase [Clostridia bacterium]|nr:FAD:protein FMN transferase [Clostridia bacterium]